jgi:hypothetical protein
MATPILALYTCKVSMNDRAPARLGWLIVVCGLAFDVRGPRALLLCGHIRV